MGGNGTFAAGKVVTFRWRTIDIIDGVKVLEPNIDTQAPKVLHYHIITHNPFSHGKARPITKAMLKKFRKYLKGVSYEE